MTAARRRNAGAAAQIDLDFTTRVERVCGVDEAGRGPLAGPVVAAAVVLDPAHPIPGLDDSKKLSATRRDALAIEIRAHALAWAVAEASVEEIAAKLPPGIGVSWTGLSYQERLSGSQAPALYAISLLVVFLCLAALYESWSIPFAVMLVVPLGVIGALLAAGLRGLSNDVYFQVGLLTTIGLSAKNAILIVEFAKAEMEHGQELVQATLTAVRMHNYQNPLT